MLNDAHTTKLRQGSLRVSKRNNCFTWRAKKSKKKRKAPRWKENTADMGAEKSKRNEMQQQFFFPGPRVTNGERAPSASASGGMDALRVRRAPYTCLSLSKKSLRAGMRDDVKCSSALNYLQQVQNVLRTPHPVAFWVAQIRFQLEGGLHILLEESPRRPAPKLYSSAPHPTLRSSILARALALLFLFLCSAA